MRSTLVAALLIIGTLALACATAEQPTAPKAASSPTTSTASTHAARAGASSSSSWERSDVKCEPDDKGDCVAIGGLDDAALDDMCFHDADKELGARACVALVRGVDGKKDRAHLARAVDLGFAPAALPYAENLAREIPTDHVKAVDVLIHAGGPPPGHPLGELLRDVTRCGHNDRGGCSVALTKFGVEDRRFLVEKGPSDRTLCLQIADKACGLDDRRACAVASRFLWPGDVRKDLAQAKVRAVRACQLGDPASCQREHLLDDVEPCIAAKPDLACLDVARALQEHGAPENIDAAVRMSTSLCIVRKGKGLDACELAADLLTDVDAPSSTDRLSAYLDLIEKHVATLTLPADRKALRAHVDAVKRLRASDASCRKGLAGACVDAARVVAFVPLERDHRLEQACALGDADGCERRSWSVAQDDIARRVSWLEKACALKGVDACTAVWSAYGLPDVGASTTVPRTIGTDEARRVIHALDLGCGFGGGDACAGLAFAHENGMLGLGVDGQQALELYLRGCSAEKSSYFACEKIGATIKLEDGKRKIIVRRR